MRSGFVRPQRRGRPEPARPDLSNAPAWLLPSLQVKPLSRHLTHQNTVTHSQAPSPKPGRVFILHTLGSPQDLVRTGAYSGTAN